MFKSIRVNLTRLHYDGGFTFQIDELGVGEQSCFYKTILIDGPDINLAQKMESMVFDTIEENAHCKCCSFLYVYTV